MAKLQINDDGTVTIPTTDGQAITLPEPSMAQMAQMVEIAQRCDAELPELPEIPRFTMTEGKVPLEVLPALTAYNEAVRERTKVAFGPASPHGAGMIEIVQMLAPDALLSADNAFGWMMSPRTMKQVVEHFQAPLPGEG